MKKLEITCIGGAALGTAAIFALPCVLAALGLGGAAAADNPQLAQELEQAVEDLEPELNDAAAAAKSVGDLSKEISPAAKNAFNTGDEAARDALTAEERATAANNLRQIGNMNTKPNAGIVNGFNNARANWLEGNGPWPGDDAADWAKANGIQ